MNNSNISYGKLLEIIRLQTEVVQQGIDLSNIMNLVAKKSQLITSADGACIELVEENELVYRAVSGRANKFIGVRLGMKNSLSGEGISEKTILVSNDIEKDDRVNKEVGRMIGIKSMIVVPLAFKDEVVGVLKVFSHQVNHFNEENVKVLEVISDVIAAAMFSAIKNEKSELIHKATHDFLTGISNRALFYDRLRQKLLQASKKNENFKIIIIDINGLKEINDNYGHRAGDAAIKEVALRIKSIMLESDIVSRLGGDEFGIILDNKKVSNINEFIKRIDLEISKPFKFEDNKIHLNVSIGYSSFGEDGIELEGLIEKADKLMYEDKKIKKGIGNIR